MRDLLNICLISQEFPPYTNWGGIGIYTRAQADGYASHGQGVTVVSRYTPGAPRLEVVDSGYTVHRIGMPISRKRFVGRTVDRVLHSRSVARLVRRLDREQCFDVLEISGTPGLEGEALFHDPEIARRMAITCHGGNQQSSPPGGLLNFAHRLDIQWALRREVNSLEHIPQIIVTSEATRAVLLEQGVDPERIVLIPAGIDTEKFHPPSKPKTGILEVGFAGRLQESKGIDFIWKVVEGLGPEAGVRFHLKGAIHWESRVETLMRLDRYSDFVVHHDRGSHEDMPDFYRGLDVLLQPSRYENFGLAYAEAMATGLLVLAGVGGSGPEVVKDGETGFLVNPDGAVDSVVEKLRIMATDNQAFADIRLAARRDVEQRFSNDTCIESKLKFYREITS